MTNRIQVIEYRGAGGPEVVTVAERTMPEPGPGEVRIAVAAAGVNRPDILQRVGLYPPTPGASDVPGLEVSGRVDRLGPGVQGIAIGDEVCALVTGGGYASHCLAPVTTCLAIPPGVSIEDAATLPETYFTVWTNLFEDGQLKTGESTLVHGGSGGIGTTAILLAKAFGANIAVTAGGSERCTACLDLGADLAIDYRREDFVAAVRAWSSDGVDAVLDMVGGDYIPRNLSCLRPRGRHISIAFLRGFRATLDIFALMRNRWVLTGSTLRNRSLEEKGRIADILSQKVWPLFGGGSLSPVVSARIPLSEAADAQQLLEESQQFGKVLLLND